MTPRLDLQGRAFASRQNADTYGEKINMTSPNAGGPYIEPIEDELARRIAQAICGDDHLTCSWPSCGCKSTKQKINAVGVVVATEIAGIKNRVRSAIGPQD